MSLHSPPGESPIEPNPNPNLTFRFPATHAPQTSTNAQPAMPTVWQTPHVDTQDELSQQYQLAHENVASRKLDSQASKTSLRPARCETDIGHVESPACEAGPLPDTPHASAESTAKVEFELPDDLPLVESNDPSLRDLYLKGRTYTLAMVVEEVLSGVSLFGGKTNKYKLCIRRVQALDNTAAPAMKQMPNSGSDRGHRVKQRKRFTEHAEKLFSEMEEEGEKLRVSLHALLAPLVESAARLQNGIKHLPSLSDTKFWANNYDEMLNRALEWDMVAQVTTSDHLMPQYLSIYTTLSQLLTREFPSATALEEIIPEEEARKDMVDLVRSIFRSAIEIKFQANTVFSLTRTMTSKLQNCLMSLQWQTKQLLGVVDCSPVYKGLRREVEEDEKSEGEQTHLTHTTREKRIVIIGTLTHIILTLRQLRLPDDKHIATLPTSYLDISTHTEDSETPSFRQEDRQILAYLTDLKSSAEFLKKYLKLHPDLIQPKFLLPFFLEMGAYTRGTILTQADKLLSGWVVWREICLTVGGWNAMQNRVNTRDPSVFNYALLGTHPEEKLSRANSTNTIQSTDTSIIGSSTAKGKGPATASGRPGSFKHKFSFALISIPPAEELAPKGSLPKDSWPTFDPIPQLTHQSSQRLLGKENVEYSLPSPIKGFNHLAGPPQKIWPAAALAVQSKGIVTRTPEQTLIYMPKTDGPPKILLDENFALEDVLRFYAAAMEEQKIMPFSVPGSSVARAYSQMKKLDEDRKKNEELVDALLSNPVEATPTSPVKEEPGRANPTIPQRTSSTERRKKIIGEMVKKLSRLAFGKSDSTAAAPTTPTKNSEYPSTLVQTSPNEISPQGGNPLSDLPTYTPSSLPSLDEEQISSITACFNLRKDFRATLRLLSEMKTEAKCLFDGEKFIREYLDALEMGTFMGPQLQIPKEFLDREYAWRKLPKGATCGGAIPGNGKKRMELD